MALTRIWSAFIIISLFVATYKFIAVDGDQQIFTQMVIGKIGDSVKVKEQEIAKADPVMVSALDTQSRVAAGTLP